ncbi:hypothetical protein PILCRDRAFT_10463 [Piloderma croceum F 1598]|uniref:Uncharacterized protein n=1 Tax=Piloderma croceum (strain F 1598) TaxID=765440 RepID=A0A0C3FI77_PILCF|nr:hypothetical protein PILCRDRAFT_10463 [Piloderma croceum F 1598]
MASYSQKSTIVSVLRIHRRQQHPSALADEPVGRLVKAVQRASSWSRVIVAYDAADTVLSQTISARPELNPGSGEDVILLPVQPWSFTVPLNAIIIRACALGASKIVFISLEMTVSADKLAQMLSLWTKETLVIGKALDPHSFQDISKANDIHGSEVGASVKLTGLTSPWNTFAIWDLSKLAKTGFLALSDTNVQPGQSAIEEVPTIALHQRLFPSESKAILVKLVDVHESASGWDTNWNDPQRTAWQQSKLATKDLSAASHLRLLGLHTELHAGNSTEPRVLHLDLSCPK